MRAGRRLWNLYLQQVVQMSQAALKPDILSTLIPSIELGKKPNLNYG
jgi:hypothetical protein